MARGVSGSNVGNLAVLNRRRQVKISSAFQFDRSNIENIGRMKDAIFTNAMREMNEIAARMRQEMVDNVSYQDQPDDAREGYGIHAREGIYAKVYRNGDVITMNTGYSGDVFKNRGTRYTYGGILETWTNYNGQYAVIKPIFDEYEDDFINALSNITAKGAIGTKRKPKPKASRR